MATEFARIASGVSEVAPEESDKRFTDPAWSDNPFYRRIMQTYLVWRSTMQAMVPEAANGEWKEAEQQRFAIRLLTEALAPTNLLIGNPAALKRAFETAGVSLVQGPIKDNQVMCVGHGWLFSLVNGECTRGPTGVKVAPYEVRVSVEGAVEVLA